MAGFEATHHGVPVGVAPIRHSHVRVAVLGDSISARTFTGSYTSPIIGASAISPWHWANWLVGAPFVMAVNLAVSGDTAKGIASRVPSVPRNIRAVVMLAGANDVNSMSASANQATIDSTYTSVSGYIGSAVSSLVAAGKVVVLSTILPNNALTPSTDSRIQLLDRLNAYIASLASASVIVVDGFAALWDSTQPTERLAKSGAMNSDKIHPTAKGAQLFGLAATEAMKQAWAKCTPDIDIYDEYQPMRPLYSEFRRSTGGTAGTISAGSGTIADGWRCINSAGTATFTVDATDAYENDAGFVGPWDDVPAPVDSYWQTFNVSSAVANDIVELRLPSNTDLTSSGNAIDGVFGGSLLFAEIEVLVESATNLGEVNAIMQSSITAGTSPVDQPSWGTAYIRGVAGVTTDNSSAAVALSPFRAVLRTPVIRIPENINSTSQLQLVPRFDMTFIGSGSAVIKFGRPRFWHKMAGRIG